MERPTVTVKGTGGAVFTLDVPAPGTPRAEWLDGLIAKGELEVLSRSDEPAKRAPRKAADPKPAPPADGE